MVTLLVIEKQTEMMNEILQKKDMLQEIDIIHDLEVVVDPDKFEKKLFIVGMEHLLSNCSFFF